MSERPQSPSGSRLAGWRWLAPLGLSILFATLCATSTFQKSGTWDEYLIGIGLRRDLPDASFHPPLSSVLHSLPFLWLEIPETLWAEPRGPQRGQQIVALHDDDRMLDAARLALLPLAVALGWLVFAWGRRLYGFAGGLLAMALYSADPNVIAHARLITPDLTLCATAAFFVYRLARLREASSARNLTIAGLALGAMLLSKYTALLLAPLFFATHGIASASGADDRRRALGRALREAVVVTAIGGLLLWAGYGFSLGTVAIGGQRGLVVPAPDYVAGALYQWQQSRLPHAFFLLGDRSSEGWWYFYLLVAAIKIPLGTGLLLALALFGRRLLDLPRRSEELYLWLPALGLLVYLSFFNTLHNGFRYLLPVWIPLLVIAGRLARPAAHSGAFRALLVAPLAWVIGAAVWSWPDYLAYCNELIGGPRNGYRVLSDSNLDWGQDLEALGDWMRRGGVERVQLAYFGTADPAHWGIDYVALPSPNSALPVPPPLPEGTPPPRLVALSAYQYQGVAFPDENPYAVFHALEPNHRVGHSILIFDLDQPIPRRPPPD
jgi:hypothetical protein